METDPTTKLGFKSHSMARSLEVDQGSVLDCLKTLQKLQRKELSFDLNPGFEGSGCGVEENKFSCLFDKILAQFLDSLCKNGRSLPLPPMLGSGESVDLLKLNLIVGENGGYDIVSGNGSWNLVAEGLGFASCLGSCIKLIYSKYLSQFEIWSQKLANEDLKRDLEDSDVMDVDTDFPEVVSDFLGPKKEDGGHQVMQMDRSVLDKTNLGNSCGIRRDVIDDVSNRKRKKEGFEEMLSWITNAAKDPCDTRLGLLPDKSKWKSYGEDKLWKQVLVTREMMMIKRNVDSVAEQSPLKLRRRLMHPSMYEDPQKVRSQRARKPSSKRQALAESPSGNSSDLEDEFGGEDAESFPRTSVFFFLSKTEDRQQVKVGSDRQAEVPEFTKGLYESDPEWLGTRVWPPEDGEKKKYLVERERTGKGRPNSCGCQHQGSAGCVGFHVAENRMKMKLDLGSVFFDWKFNKMGEEVALSWTKKEEEIFQGVIRSNPLRFWGVLVKMFPLKKWEELVSYYFNVYMLRRRSYQNRSTPCTIDSDDEKLEFGSLSGLRHKSGESQAPEFIPPESK